MRITSHISQVAFSSASGARAAFKDLGVEARGITICGVEGGDVVDDLLGVEA